MKLTEEEQEIVDRHPELKRQQELSILLGRLSFGCFCVGAIALVALLFIG